MEETHEQAILVLGPESSGTRFVTSVFIAAGCTGDADHGQRFDLRLPTEPRIVWRRSFPHNYAWPDARELIDRLRETGYDVSVAVTSRDWHCMASSQVKSGHVSETGIAMNNIRRAYLDIFQALYDTSAPFVVVSYESLVHYREAALKRMLAEFGLMPGASEIRDANRRYFESPKCDEPCYSES